MKDIYIGIFTCQTKVTVKINNKVIRWERFIRKCLQIVHNFDFC